MRKLREFFAKFYGWLAAGAVIVGGLIFSFGDHRSPIVRRTTTVTEKVIETKTADSGNIAANKNKTHAIHEKSHEVGIEVSKTVPQASRSADQTCERLEYPGKMTSQLNTTPDNWSIFMEEFHNVKNLLVTWLHKNQNYFSNETVKVMESNIRQLKISRPGVFNEPDISIRGIGVLSWDNQGEPIARLGAGFFDFMKADSARARFELARLVSQVWAPCELERLNVGKPWAELLKCMNIQDNDSCKMGSFSEEGWAVSSLVAVWTAHPGCSIPAFKDSTIAVCLSDFESFMKIKNKEQWKEAKR